MTQQESIDYNTDLEQLLKLHAEECESLSILHRNSYEKYNGRSNYINIPVIILSSAIGFATGIDIGYEKMNIILGISSIFVGIIKSIDTYFQLGKRAESHRLCSLQFQQINKKIQIELALVRSQRVDAKDMMNIIKTDIKNLFDIAPLIDQDVIESFKKKYGHPVEGTNKVHFDAHTPNLCNGLSIVTINSAKNKQDYEERSSRKSSRDGSPSRDNTDGGNNNNNGGNNNNNGGNNNNNGGNNNNNGGNNNNNGITVVIDDAAIALERQQQQQQQHLVFQQQQLAEVNHKLQLHQLQQQLQQFQQLQKSTASSTPSRSDHVVVDIPNAVYSASADLVSVHSSKPGSRAPNSVRNTAAPNSVHNTAPNSVHNTATNSVHNTAPNSVHNTAPNSVHNTAPNSVHNTAPNSVHNTAPNSVHNTAPNSVHGGTTPLNADENIITEITEIAELTEEQLQQLQQIQQFQQIMADLEGEDGVMM